MIYVEFSGGLGNQMFSYAFGRALSLAHSEPLTLLDREEWRDGGPAHTGCALRQLKVSPDVAIRPLGSWAKEHLPVQNAAKALMIKREQRGGMMARDWHPFEAGMAPWLNRLGLHFVSDGYIPVRRGRLPKHFYAWGYFQSPAYFESAREVLREEFTPASPFSPPAQALAEAIDACECPVCLHWRCGDYLAPENAALQVCTPDYYAEACRRVKERFPKATLFIFSDSPDYVKDRLDPAGLPAVFPAGSRTALEDMMLMRRCRHFIISNSTFSWWAQYLAEGPDKTVFAPDRWFANGRESALYQKSWNLLPTR